MVVNFEIFEESPAKRLINVPIFLHFITITLLCYY